MQKRLTEVDLGVVVDLLAPAVADAGHDDGVGASAALLDLAVLAAGASPGSRSPRVSFCSLGFSSRASKKEENGQKGRRREDSLVGPAEVAVKVAEALLQVEPGEDLGAVAVLADGLEDGLGVGVLLPASRELDLVGDGEVGAGGLHAVRLDGAVAGRGEAGEDGEGEDGELHLDGLMGFG